jgi:hypothetical protein
MVFRHVNPDRLVMLWDGGTLHVVLMSLYVVALGLLLLFVFAS